MVRSGPAEDVKRAAAEDLAELADKFGLTMIELALAFVINHPAVTSAIIGPRTMEQLEAQLSAPDVTLPEELLDAIDDIVPPGTTLNPADVGWTPPSLEARNRRR
jgi:aryl-alcohol dehydrogenase-like predicted oxidoreductase